MTQVEKYQCEYCYKLFGDEKQCQRHEENHRLVNEANDLLDDGLALQQINENLKLWLNVPAYLKNVTKDNCFVVEYWQCCRNPAYKISKITEDRELFLWGYGGWSGRYGGAVSINDNDLENPRPKKELFVYDGRKQNEDKY